MQTMANQLFHVGLAGKIGYLKLNNEYFFFCINNKQAHVEYHAGI